MSGWDEAAANAWLEDMNAGHGEALICLARYFGGIADPLVVEATGLNRDELHLRVDGHGLSCTLAVPWPEPARTLEDVRRMVVDMTREARRGAREEGLLPDGDAC